MNKLLQFSYAEYHRGKSNYVSYYVVNPITGIWCRKKVMLDKIKNISKREKTADRLIKEIDKKLDEGWNPFIQENPNNQFKLLRDIIAEYLASCALMVETDELRERTLDAYTRELNEMKDFFKASTQLVFPFSIKEEDAYRFMDNLKLSRKIGPVTYNYWLYNISTFWNWMIKRKYAISNPFKAVVTKSVPKKKKISIPDNYIHLVKDYCIKNDPGQWIIIGWIFYCCIRRTELSRLQIKNINFKDQKIRILHTQAKNHFEEDINIPDEFFNLLLKLKYDKYKPDYFLISKTKFPGPKKVHPNSLNRWFNEMKVLLDLPEVVQLYRFKHTMMTRIASVNLVAAKNHGRYLRIEDMDPYMSENEAQKNLLRDLKA